MGKPITVPKVGGQDPTLGRETVNEGPQIINRNQMNCKTISDTRFFHVCYVLLVLEL